MPFINHRLEYILSLFLEKSKVKLGKNSAWVHKKLFFSKNVIHFFSSVTKSKIRIKISFKVLLARRRNWRVAFPSFTTTEREKSFSLQSFHPRLGLWNGEITNRSCCCFWKQTLTSSFFEIFSTYMYDVPLLLYDGLRLGQIIYIIVIGLFSIVYSRH